MSETPTDTPRHPRRLGWLFVFYVTLTLCGPVLIHTSHQIEEARRATLPWTHALLAIAPESPWPGARPAWIRSLPLALLPDGPVVSMLSSQEGGRELVRTLCLDQGERLVMLDTPPEDWQPMLASGRTPVPGTGEVVAGPICRLDSFTLDGMTFRVVGRLSPGVTAFPMAYLCPQGPTLDDDPETRRAWLYPDGPPEDLSDEQLADDAEGLEILGGIAPTWADLAMLSLLGMAIALLGGTLAWLRLLGAIGEWLPGWKGAVFHDLHQYRMLVVLAHALLYGLFLGFALIAMASPVSSWRMGLYAQSQFESGALSFVGEAYAGGNVFRAALATWLWNFGAATVLFTVLISMIIPFLGVAKNLLSFAVVGLALSPIWTGVADKMTYHAGTMVLELEAYVLISIIMTLYPWHLARAVFARDGSGGGPRVRHALASVFTATLLAGAILALAALYEAATLIGFNAV